MGSHDTDEQYIVYTDREAFINILACWWPADGLLMACIGRNQSPLFKLTKHKTVVFDELHILFHFNIILKHNGMSSTETVLVVPATFQLPH
jgi:hypothetical protein